MKRIRTLQVLSPLRNLLVTALLSLSLGLPLYAQTVPSVESAIRYLASDELGGRKAGERGDSLSAIFIRDAFVSAGLELLFDKGWQSFSLVNSVELGPLNHFMVRNESFAAEVDFLPYSFSASKNLKAPLVFAGYGFDIRTDDLEWDDYRGLEVEGKWVMMLKGEPDLDKTDSRFADYSGERAKVLTALDKGVGGVILVGGSKFSEQDVLQKLFYDKNSSTYSIPVVQITRKLADLLLSTDSINGLEQKLNSDRAPHSFLAAAEVLASVDVIQKTAETHNVAAILHGNDPLLRSEYVVIGAHYDHLGLGGPGSGSRSPDTIAIHYGADDNASGVAAMLAMAEKAAREKSNRRSLIFAAFGAEEMGLIGATAFTANSPVPLTDIRAMINFDMVGRLNDDHPALSIGGTQTSLETEEMLERLNPGFALSLSGEGYGPSDHAAFYMHDIPVFFVSTGAHPDYHTPEDTPDKINFVGINRVADYLWSVASEVANREGPLTFQEAGARSRRNQSTRMRVTLGVMPDFAGQERNGMRIDAVTKGRPAELAGMLKGDIITAINGNPVGNIYDYMNRLNGLEVGQTISIDVLREGEPRILIVQL